MPDPDALTFTLRTSQGEAFVFDVTTGKIIRHWSPFPMFIGILLTAVGMAIAFLVLLLRRGTRQSLHGNSQ